MIPVNEPIIGEKEFEYVTECLRSGWISSAGRFIEEFEKRWAAYCGMKYGIAMSNGTTALQTAVGCLKLKPGDKIIIPTFTIISCALAVIYNQCIPVLVDCEPDTWCMNIEQVKQEVEKNYRTGDGRIKAIMPVHIYGHPVDMDPINELAERYALYVVEDAAEVHGAEYLSCRNGKKPTWKRCGGLGHISTFSFYANKLITTGEGGMVLTNDRELAENARSLRNLCFRPDRRFYHTELGNNFRMTNLQAAIGVAQLERMEEIIAKKRWLGQAYTERLRDIPCLQLPLEKTWAKQVYWMYGVVLNESTGMDVVAFASQLKDQGVETRPFFLGMHEQPVFQTMNLFLNERYPIAEYISRQGLYLPSGLALTELQLDKICKIIKGLLL